MTRTDPVTGVATTYKIPTLDLTEHPGHRLLRPQGRLVPGLVRLDLLPARRSA